MMIKKTITGVLITLLIATTICGIVTALDTTQNETIEMNGIKFVAPKTDNYTITDVKAPNGVWTWTYSDDKNEITVYVSDADMPEYKLYTEQWNEYEGYTQMFPVGDKYVMVGSQYEENKDFIVDSLKLFPENNMTA